MTTVLLRELLKDYLNGKLPLEDQCDFDIALKQFISIDLIIILLYAMDYSPVEIAGKLSERIEVFLSPQQIEQQLKINLMLLGETLHISDKLLYRRVSPKKHGQLRSFLVFANEHYESLDEVVALWRSI